jgi:hypothetical protein
MVWRALRASVGIIGGVVLSSCGCDAIGYPAVAVTVVENTTGAPVPLGGAVISYQNEQEPSSFSEPWPSSNMTSTFSICCLPGVWNIQIRKAGYVDYDTTLIVRAKGRCDTPELVHLTARLERIHSERLSELFEPNGFR